MLYLYSPVHIFQNQCNFEKYFFTLLKNMEVITVKLLVQSFGQFSSMIKKLVTKKSKIRKLTFILQNFGKKFQSFISIRKKSMHLFGMKKRSGYVIIYSPVIFRNNFLISFRHYYCAK